MTPYAALKQQSKLPEPCRLSVADILFKTALRHDATGEPLKDVFFEFVEKSKNELSKKAFDLCVAIYRFNHVDFFIEAKNQSALMAQEKEEKIKELQNFFKSRGWIKKTIAVEMLTDVQTVRKPIYQNHKITGYRFEKVRCKPVVSTEQYPFFVRKITRGDTVTQDNVLDGQLFEQYVLLHSVYPAGATEQVTPPDVFKFDSFNELTDFLFGDKNEH
jgi:hypothetical protein